MSVCDRVVRDRIQASALRIHPPLSHHHIPPFGPALSHRAASRYFLPPGSYFPRHVCPSAPTVPLTIPGYPERELVVVVLRCQNHKTERPIARTKEAVVARTGFDARHAWYGGCRLKSTSGRPGELRCVAAQRKSQPIGHERRYFMNHGSLLPSTHAATLAGLF
jgi:hypothetical protein